MREPPEEMTGEVLFARNRTIPTGEVAQTIDRILMVPGYRQRAAHVRLVQRQALWAVVVAAMAIGMVAFGFAAAFAWWWLRP